jgi:hydrogenase maturation protease
MSQHAPVSIVGAGHWMITCDSIGPRVLELLAGRYQEDVVELVEVGTAGLGLLDHMRGQPLMVIVDACVDNDHQPGDVIVRDVDLAHAPSRESSVHQIGPIETLQVAKHLYPDMLPQRTLLVLVETREIDEQTHERACRQVVEQVDKALARYLSADPPFGGS